MTEDAVEACLVGRWTTCRPLRPEDLPFAYRTLTEGTAAWRLRYRGRSPSFEEFAAQAWEDVLAQWVVVSTATGAPRGLVVVASPNFLDGHAYVSVVASRDARGTGLLLEAAGRCIDYTFLCWPLRKLCADVLDLNLAQFASGMGRWFEVEGQRRSHVYAAGQYRDVYHLAIMRDTWVRARSTPEDQPVRNTVRSVPPPSGRSAPVPVFTANGDAPSDTITAPPAGDHDTVW